MRRQQGISRNREEPTKVIGSLREMTTPSEQLPLLDLDSPVDAELQEVVRHLRIQDPEGSRTADVVRRTYDVLYNGQHTGHYRWDQLLKTEKTHFGTLLEIHLQREFGFADGKDMDFSISGIDVDCKFAQKEADWMIPPEALGHILFGFWANDQKGLWSAGVVRADEAVLTSESSSNRDRKRRLAKAGKATVSWVFRNRPLAENALLRMPPHVADEILACSTSGQKRVDMLFRKVQGRLVSRAVVATVAQQPDYMKRIRGNGGSRTTLKPEGIVILGQYRSHGAVARALGLPVPGPGESLSVRLARRQPHHAGLPSVTLDGDQWVTAQQGDPVEPAPDLPTTHR
jgi:hypothetical protein